MGRHWALISCGRVTQLVHRESYCGEVQVEVNLVEEVKAWAQ